MNKIIKKYPAKLIWWRVLTAMLLFLCVLNISGQQAHEHEQEQQEDRHRGRLYWQMPERIMNEIGVKPGMTVADVGAGDGYFTTYLSERVGKEGKVFASDIDSRALTALKNKAQRECLNNISVILGKNDDPLLPAQSMDLVLMVNVIHLVKNPTAFIQNTGKSLKPGAPLVLVQWDAERMRPEMPGWDPEDQELYTLRTNLRKIYDAGFEVVQLKNFLPMQRIYICRPADKE